MPYYRTVPQFLWFLIALNFKRFFNASAEFKFKVTSLPEKIDVTFCSSYFGLLDRSPLFLSMISDYSPIRGQETGQLSYMAVNGALSCK